MKKGEEEEKRKILFHHIFIKDYEEEDFQQIFSMNKIYVILFVDNYIFVVFLSDDLKEIFQDYGMNSNINSNIHI